MRNDCSVKFIFFNKYLIIIHCGWTHCLITLFLMLTGEVSPTMFKFFFTTPPICSSFHFPDSPQWKITMPFCWEFPIFIVDMFTSDMRAWPSLVKWLTYSPWKAGSHAWHRCLVTLTTRICSKLPNNKLQIPVDEALELILGICRFCWDQLATSHFSSSGGFHMK